MFPKYFSSEWSFAQFRVKEGLQHIANFGKQKNTLDIVGFDGRYINLHFLVICFSLLNIDMHCCRWCELIDDLVDTDFTDASLIR